MASPLPQLMHDDAAMGMSARIRAFDWASTPLGPMDGWPDALRLATTIAEHSAFPTAVYWGPDLRLIYNDAWAPIPGERHPAALGRPAREVWADIWPIVGPQFDEVVATARGISAFEQMLPMIRDGAEQETYWNYSLTPILDRDGKVVGVFNQGSEITKAVMNERRLSFQVALADRLRGLRTPAEVKAAAAAQLGQYLSAARVGFAEIDEAVDSVTITSEWTRDPAVPPLIGRVGRFSELPPAAIEHLRAGEVLAIGDVDNLLRGSSEADSALGSKLGVRAVVTVPLVREGALRAMLYVHEPEVRQWKRSEAAMARDVAERSWAAVERAETEQRLRESEDHYRHAVELNPQVSWTALPDGQLNRVARRWHDWTGTEGTGESWAEGLHPDDRQRTFDVWAHCVATGEPYDIEHRVRYRDGSYRWARSRAIARRDEAGDICLWYGATEDIHERKTAEEHQRLLINELNHRVKNTLATVQAIAFQTLKGDIPLHEARARFEARLLALSRAHNLLTDQNWEGASMERVVSDSTEYLAAGRGRFEIEGEPIWLAPRSALALALALHELSTNAAKYGSLSSEEGTVSIRWCVRENALRLEWKERNGPPVAEPASRGFGSRLIERGLESDLGGTARLHFEPDGLCCVIEASMHTIQAREAENG
jgi:PAS domain S-box-containing protein